MKISFPSLLIVSFQGVDRTTRIAPLRRNVFLWLASNSRVCLRNLNGSRENDRTSPEVGDQTDCKLNFQAYSGHKCQGRGIFSLLALSNGKFPV